MLSLAQAAARNNAEWCDLVCRSHGLKTRWDKAAWVSERRSPPFYPDAVSLTGEATVADLLDGKDGSAGCSVKDSFASLDLTPAGFRILFEAQWIRRPPGPDHGDAEGPRWRAVRTAEELRVWAAAHGGGEVFRPELLAHPGVTVLGAYDGERLVGGAVANRSDNLVGLSNVFAANDNPGTIWVTVAGAVSAAHPGLPIVGYESGADLATAREAGFVAAGPLRVWLLP